tara:strand:+ start:31897 stop:32496 length:600 start_codon:yes stop_codon:yes gene_type:complete
MRGSNYFITVFWISSLLIACGNTSNENKSQEDSSYRIYNLEKTGWKSKSITHSFKDISYKATAVPIEYYILKNNTDQTIQAIDSISKTYENERIIEFEFEQIQSKDLLDSEFTGLDYDKSVNYMASIIKNDFLVVTESNDTIPCSGVHFERHFKVSPFNRILLYFEGIAPSENIQLIYQDRLFQQGIFKFKFNETPFKT